MCELLRPPESERIVTVCDVSHVAWSVDKDDALPDGLCISAAGVSQLSGSTSNMLVLTGNPREASNIMENDGLSTLSDLLSPTTAFVLPS